ncbi:MAG: hypothetical protein M5U09_04605 [Gammaproteobacteria bacterium]|nr:hypothetical protein [Gammaproteobacteria bacterium]
MGRALRREFGAGVEHDRHRIESGRNGSVRHCVNAHPAAAAGGVSLGQLLAAARSHPLLVCHEVGYQFVDDRVFEWSVRFDDRELDRDYELRGGMDDLINIRRRRLQWGERAAAVLNDLTREYLLNRGDERVNPRTDVAVTVLGTIGRGRRRLHGLDARASRCARILSGLCRGYSVRVSVAAIGSWTFANLVERYMGGPFRRGTRRLAAVDHHA